MLIPQKTILGKVWNILPLQHVQQPSVFSVTNQQTCSVPLHEASTFQLDECIRKCALKLEDKPLLAKLSTGDMTAQEAKYHTQCLVAL